MKQECETIQTVKDLKEILETLNDNDQVCLETIDLETGDVCDLFPFYIDVIDGIELTTGEVINEVRFCQKKQDEWLPEKSVYKNETVFPLVNDDEKTHYYLFGDENTIEILINEGIDKLNELIGTPELVIDFCSYREGTNPLFIMSKVEDYGCFSVLTKKEYDKLNAL